MDVDAHQQVSSQSVVGSAWPEKDTMHTRRQFDVSFGMKHLSFPARENRVRSLPRKNEANWMTLHLHLCCQGRVSVSVRNTYCDYEGRETISIYQYIDILSVRGRDLRNNREKRADVQYCNLISAYSAPPPVLQWAFSVPCPCLPSLPMLSPSA